MYKFKDKLSLKAINEIAEIRGVYPASQGGLTIPGKNETVYVINLCGQNCYFPQSVVDILFQEIKETVPVIKSNIEEIADEIIEKKESKPRSKKVTK